MKRGGRSGGRWVARVPLGWARTGFGWRKSPCNRWPRRVRRGEPASSRAGDSGIAWQEYAEEVYKGWGMLAEPSSECLGPGKGLYSGNPLGMAWGHSWPWPGWVCGWGGGEHETGTTWLGRGPCLSGLFFPAARGPGRLGAQADRRGNAVRGRKALPECLGLPTGMRGNRWGAERGLLVGRVGRGPGLGYRRCCGTRKERRPWRPCKAGNWRKPVPLSGRRGTRKKSVTGNRPTGPLLHAKKRRELSRTWCRKPLG